ncbi:nuclease-related domain-containing protein [Pseudanabaena yagii]|uniref:NERD domain-containing protein n=1 Tax=Pseudanabaena yagii GIHE-NHR1 TaxID=2722753 RepID=A0ABX1LTC2_9CYAN|nr:nuclease-related domain-containing protein [Pseudanabaena yagii]NMF58074.1 NERD domain-containing protein [Pseudanabaena yagii GIHE-NHR1]
MSKFSRHAGKNIRELAMRRRAEAFASYITAGLIGVIWINSITSIFSVPLIIIAIGLIANGAFLWKRANHADQGAKGEEDIAQAIAQLENQDWQIEYGIQLGNRLGDLDIFCISPQGKAFAIDVKSHRGEVITDGKELYRRMGNKKYPFEKNFIQQVIKQALQIKQQKDLPFVTPIVAFSTARVSIQGDKLKNVYVVEKAKLVSLLKSLG